MRIADKAIVLQSIRHGDNKYILKLYTLHHGLLTVAAAAGRSATAKVRAANIMPLSQVDVQLVVKQNKEVHQLTEAAAYSIHTGISGSLSKLSIAQFLNEVLIRSLREQMANAHLFAFVESCFQFLNAAEQGYTNLHLYFLAELTRYLGIEPQNNCSPQDLFFDLREGRFSAQCLALPLGLDRDNSQLFSSFLKINALKQHISPEQRDALLDIWLAYYRLHVPGFNDLRSLEVLREVAAAARV